MGTFPGRPIMAAIGSLFKSLDIYLATLTFPLLPKIPHSLMDTTSLINDVNKIKKLPSEAILFSADVESLYPSIPWNEGLAASRKFYEKNFLFLWHWCLEKKWLPPPPPPLFELILKTILENNIFHFQENCGSTNLRVRLWGAVCRYTLLIALCITRLRAF